MKDYNDVEKLVTIFGEACENFGDCQSVDNAKATCDAEQELLAAIKELYDKVESQK